MWGSTLDEDEWWELWQEFADMDTSISLNEGDIVYIKTDEETKGNVGRFAGEKAKVTKVHGIHSVSVETGDGSSFVCHVNWLEKHSAHKSTDPRIRAAFPNKETPPCHHPNAYVNVISRSVKFKVCPDCKKDLGTVK